MSNYLDYHNILFIDSAGKVGIGTDNPANKLHIKNDTTDNTYALIENTTTGNAGINIKNSQGDWSIIANADLRFIDNAVGAGDIMRITSDGNVGIGDMLPDEDLVVAGRAYHTQSWGWNRHGGINKVKFEAGADLISIYHSSSEGYNLLQYGNETNYENFRAEFKFKVSSNESHLGFGFGGASSDPHNNMWSVVLRTDNNTVRLQKRVSGTQSYFPTSGYEVSSGINVDDALWHTVVVERMGRYIKVYVDGSQRINSSDFPLDTMNQGMVGFTTYRSNSDVHFRDFRIERLGSNVQNLSDPIHIRKVDITDNTDSMLLTLDGKFVDSSIESNDHVGITFRVENSGGGAEQSNSITYAHSNRLHLQKDSGTLLIGTEDNTWKYITTGTNYGSSCAKVTIDASSNSGSIVNTNNALMLTSPESTYMVFASKNTNNEHVRTGYIQGVEGQGMRIANDSALSVTNNNAYIDILEQHIYMRSSNNNEPLATLYIDELNNHGGIVMNAAGNQTHLRFQDNGTLKWQVRCPFHDTTNPDSMRFYSWTNGDDVMTLKNNGHVGIGTTTPNYQLEVNGGEAMTGNWSKSLKLTAAHPVICFAGSNGGTFGFIGYDAASTTEGLSLSVAGTSDDRSTSTLGIKIDSTGNVGIGTSGPDYKLQVEGSTSFRAGGTHYGSHEFAATTTSTAYNHAAIEIREENYGTATANAPRLAFHWGGRVASQISIDTDAAITIRDNPGTGYEDLKAATIYSNGYRCLTTNDEGSGSGLDADTVDGLQASNFLRSGSSTQTIYGGQIVASDWLRNNASGEGLYNSVNDAHFYSAGANYWHINGDNGAQTAGGLIFYNQYNSVAGDGTGRQGYIYWSSQGFGLLSNDGSWSVRCSNTHTDIWGTIRHEGTNTVWHAGNDGSGSGLDADTVDGVHGGSFLRSDASDTFTGKLSVGSTTSRQAGMYGIYDSTKTGHIWSMGTNYVINSSGTDFGTLYGFGYKHTNNATGGTMGGGHMAVWCQNGTPYVSLGSNIWCRNNITAYSDARVKDDITTITNAVDKVKSIRGVTYRRTDFDSEIVDSDESNKRHMGVIAQEILDVIPEVVTGGPTEQDPEGHYSVAYGNMVALLIEAVKEQQTQLDKQQQQIEQLKQQIEK